jgi:hypothetical protein
MRKSETQLLQISQHLLIDDITSNPLLYSACQPLPMLNKVAVAPSFELPVHHSDIILDFGKEVALTALKKTT